MSEASDWTQLTELRRLAERRLGAPSDVGQVPRLVYELEVQKVELELQNEQLRTAQLELQVSCDRYFELYDLAPVAYLTLDAAGRVVEANLRAADLLGVPRAQLVDSNLAQHLASTPALSSHLRDVFSEDPTRHHRCELRLGEQGRSRVVQLETVPVYREGVEPHCRTALADVTAVAEAERQAREAEGKLRAVLDTATDGVIAVSADGTIESFNRAAERMFGLAAQEVIGRSVRCLLPSPLREELDHYMATNPHRQVPGILRGPREVQGLRADGSTFPLELSVGERGPCAGYTGIVRDLSDRKQLEYELQQSQKLESVGRLASGLAHEYKNLLMGIQGFTGLALEQLKESPARRHVEEIRATAIRGSGLAAQLLALSRPTVPSRQRRRSLDRLIVDSESLLRAVLSENVELQLDVQAPTAEIQAEAGAVEQILLNLVLNASEAMPAGGRIEIATRVLGAHVVWTVADTGTGMSEVTRRRLFEPFFTTKGGSGTGLGLVAVERVVRQLGGQIEVETSYGEGTAFRILLPLAPRSAPVERAPTTSPPAQTPSNRTVLVVEDERLVLVTVDHYLQRAGYHTLLAQDPEAALALVAPLPQGSVDILLTDVSLPGMSGRELAARMRRREPGLFVLFMSAYPRAQLVEQDLIDPDSPTLEKPFDEEELTQRLAELLRG